MCEGVREGARARKRDEEEQGRDFLFKIFFLLRQEGPNEMAFVCDKQKDVEGVAGGKEFGGGGVRNFG